MEQNAIREKPSFYAPRLINDHFQNFKPYGIPSAQLKLEAADAVLAHFEASEPLTVCAGCPMARLDDCGDPVACGAEKCVKGKE